MLRKVGVGILEDVEAFDFYDGPLSGFARSIIPDMPYVWFTGVAASLSKSLARAYSLAPLSDEQYAQLVRLAGRAAIYDPQSEEPSVELATLLASVPEARFVCLSDDGLTTIFGILDFESISSLDVPRCATAVGAHEFSWDEALLVAILEAFR